MAPYRKEVYCEFEFLKKFRSSNGRFSPFGNGEPLRRWLDVAKFIQKSHLMLNIDCQTFDRALNGRGDSDTLRQLWKQSTGGGCKISFEGEEHNNKYFENLISNPDGLNKVYLLAKENDAIYKDYAKKYGIVILSPTCWQSNDKAQKSAYLFKDCGSVVKQEEAFEWRGILRSEYSLSNCNAMVIIDNYIHGEIEQNLFPIIEAMLPLTLKQTTFHLTILTQRNNKANYENIYRQIVKKIKRIRPELDCIVELYVKTGKGDFHDRTILTNNVKIDSGAGFSLINNSGKPKNSTEIHILHPGLQNCSDTCDISYINTLETAKKFVSKIDKDSCGYGERFPKNQKCQNRLIIIHENK